MNSSNPVPSRRRPAPLPFRACAPWLALVPLMLVAVGSSACYHSTGLQRSSDYASEIPAEGGDRVGGLKSAGASGDFYLGNDNVQIVVDGSPFLGSREPVAGAVSGGSIIDAGRIFLDYSYHRISMPGDALDRLTPVANQDPSLPLVFDTFKSGNSGEHSWVTMTGYLYDASHKVSGATWDGNSRVQGVTVTHTASILSTLDTYITLETTLTNTSSGAIGIRSLGDHLYQRGTLFRLNVPASLDASGSNLSTWGVEIPGTSFSTSASVQAGMVGFMGSELSASDVDFHGGLGLLPLDDAMLWVASDAQSVLSTSSNASRPVFSQNAVAGSVPTSVDLAAGASLTFRRRLYIAGGPSETYSYGADSQLLGFSSQATGLFNVMAKDRYERLGMAYGTVQFTPYGTAARGSAFPTEIRFERYTGSASDPSLDTSSSNWSLERTEWMEPGENYAAANPVVGVLLQAGTYRIGFRHRLGSSVAASPVYLYKFRNTGGTTPDTATLLTVGSGQVFVVNAADYVCPENALSGTSLFAAHSFRTLTGSGVDQAFQPLRFTLKGTSGTSDPNFLRSRSVGGYWDAYTQTKLFPTFSDSTLGNMGAYHFMAGNQIFGSSFNTYAGTSLPLLPGSYTTYGTRGPLAALSTTGLTVTVGQTDLTHDVTMSSDTLPSGWTSFDLPGPSQATTGGLNPSEKLSSALAEGIQVVGSTEQDRMGSGRTLYDSFRVDFTSSSATDDQRAKVSSDPFVVTGRTSILSSYGTFTSLFTPEPTSARNGGALSATSWTLADFLAQAGGSYVVAHRPRGSAGLFVLKSFDPTVALGTGVNAWWSGTGTYAQGRTHGSFDAIELLRGQSWDASAPDTWFTEFKTLRTDWFAILKQQTPTFFTKALGLSSSQYSLDTPVGLARTYVKASSFSMDDLSPVLSALQSGAVVASTGPMLDVSVGRVGPGGLVAGPSTSVTLTVSVIRADWVPVDEVRILVNGSSAQTQAFGSSPAANGWTVDGSDSRKWTQTFTLNLSTLTSGKDAWIVVEGGVPLTTTGTYGSGTAWNYIMRGIYPIAVTNPIFVDVNGGGYTAPGL